MGMQAIRSAWRRLLSRPGHSALSIGILSLGLIAAMFLFGSVNSLVLRPLPFPDAERLVAVGWNDPASIGGELDGMDTRDWLAIRDALPMFDRIAVDGGQATVNISHGESVKRYSGAMIDAQLPALFDVQPLLGRLFSAEDDRPGAAMTVVLGEHVWRDDFGADPGVIGRVVRSNGQAATIIGVLPAWFAYPLDQEVWIPRRLALDDQFSVQVTARLAEGVSLDQAQVGLTELGRRLGNDLSGSRDGAALGLQPLHHRFVDQTTRHILWMMFGAGLLVLLLACINVANLQLAAMLPRRRELAVRSALGAGRGRLLRDLLAEALLMAVIASLLAMIGNDLLSRFFARHMESTGLIMPFFVSISYDWRDLVFVPFVALLTCLASGLIPALRAAGTDAQDALRDGSKGSQGGFFARVSRALVIGEIALTVVLLVGAAMFIRGISGMASFDYGARSDPATVLTGRIGLFETDHPGPVERLAFYERLADRLREDPQVLAASTASGMPGISGSTEDFMAEGAARPAGGHLKMDMAFVDRGFAEVYGLGLREGRFFDQRDTADSLPVAVIDQRSARQLWPGRDPLGQRLVMNPDGDQPRTLTVVGVIDNLHLRRAGSQSHRPSVLVPFAQEPTRFATIAVRLRGDANAFGSTLAETVRSVDANTPVYWVQSHASAIRDTQAGMVILTQMFTGVGILTLILAAAGLYGVLAFSVEQRTREIGIRRAIGSDRIGVAALVFRRIVAQLLLGLGIGVALALPWSAVLANPAFHTRAYDPVIFGGTIAMVLVVALLSGLVPLRRALRVDPMVALRHQ